MVYGPTLTIPCAVPPRQATRPRSAAPPCLPPALGSMAHLEVRLRPNAPARDTKRPRTRRPQAHMVARPRPSAASPRPTVQTAEAHPTKPSDTWPGMLRRDPLTDTGQDPVSAAIDRRFGERCARRPGRCHTGAALALICTRPREHRWAACRRHRGTSNRPNSVQCDSVQANSVQPRPFHQTLARLRTLFATCGRDSSNHGAGRMTSSGKRPDAKSGGKP